MAACSSSSTMPSPQFVAVHTNPERQFIFEEVTIEDKIKVRARVVLANGTIQSINQKVKLPTPLPCYAHKCPSKAEKIKCILRNCHLVPTLEEVNQQIIFQTIPPRSKEWKRISDIHKFPGIFNRGDFVILCRSDETFCYSFCNTITVWDLTKNRCWCESYPTLKITAIGELPNHRLIVGDDQGFLYPSPTAKPIKVGEGQITEIHSLTSEKLVVLLEVRDDSFRKYFVKIVDLLTMEDTSSFADLIDDSQLEDDDHGSTSTGSSPNSDSTKLERVSDINLDKEPFSQVLIFQEKVFFLQYGQFKFIDLNISPQQIQPVDMGLRNVAKIQKISHKQILITHSMGPKDFITIYNVKNLEIENTMEKSCVGNSYDYYLVDSKIFYSNSNSVVFYDLLKKKLSGLCIENHYPIISNLLSLSDGSLMCATNPSGPGLHIIDNGKERISLINRREDSLKLADDNAIIHLEELPSGSVLVVCQDKAFVIEQKRNNPFTMDSEVEALLQHLKYKPFNLFPYRKLKEIYSQRRDHEKLYFIILAGLEASLKYKNPYYARHFFKAIQAITPLPAHDRHHQIVVHLYQMQLRQNMLTIFKSINQPPISEPSPLSGKRCKQRLLIGEGNFSFTEALIKAHEHSHPDLPKAITATDLYNPLNNFFRQNDPEGYNAIKNRINTLMSKGVKIMIGINATVLDKVFVGRRFERIQWVCPFGDPRERESFHGVIPQFFQAASKLQAIGDRIHIVLSQSEDYFQARQSENPIVLGSAEAGYRLIRKRWFDVLRYPEYNHAKTAGTSSDDGIRGQGNSNFREFVFEKTEKTLSKSSIFAATKLTDGNEKKYSIKEIRYDKQPSWKKKLIDRSSHASSSLSDDTEPEIDHEMIFSELANSYFDCSTDEDTSDYEIYDPFE